MTTLACLVAIWDCGSGGGGDPQPVVLPALAVAAAPPVVDVVQGRTASATITISRTGFTGPVTLQTGALPEGVSAQFTPETLLAGSSTATVTITATSSAPVRLSPLGVQVRSVTPALASSLDLSINVISSVARAVTTTFNPPQLSLFPGDRGDATVTFGRVGGYTGAITPTVEGPVAGVTTTFLPNGMITDSYIMRVEVATSVTAGSKTFFVVPSTPSIGAQTRGVFTLDVKTAPDFALDKSRGQLASFQGLLDTTTVFITRTGDPGPVSLSLVGAPAGLTATFAETSTTGTSTKATFTASNTAPSIVAPGTYNFFIRGTATYRGATQTRDTPISYTVMARPVGSFSLASGNMTVAPGSSTSSLVTVNRAGGFTGPVDLAIGLANQQQGQPSLPAGMAITFDESPVTLASTTIRVTTTTATPAGRYTMTLRGSSAFISPAETTLDIVVAAPRVATSIAATKLVNGVAQVTTAETLPLGLTVALSAVVRDQTNAVILGAPVAWTSSNAAVATVSTTGEVTGVAAGSTTVVVRPADNPNSIQAAVSITVTAPAGGQVTHIEIEPANSLITAPGVQTFRARLFNAAGGQIAKDANGAVEFISSNSAIAEVTSTGVRNGVDTAAVSGKSGGTVTVTARYLVAGQVQRSDATSLVVNAPGTANSQGSVHISTAGDVRTLRRGQSVLFQLIVRNAAGQLVTSGFTPTIDVSDAAALSIAPASVGQPGFFYTMTAAANAPIGSSVLLRYTVPGASGSTRIQIEP